MPPLRAMTMFWKFPTIAPPSAEVVDVVVSGMYGDS